MAKEQNSPPFSFIRARRPDRSECTINLIELEDALSGVYPGETYFRPDTGQIIVHFHEADLGAQEVEEEISDDDEEPSEDSELLPIEPISSREKFGWMEDFIETVHSVPLQSALRKALRDKKPFRNFKDALLEYPRERQNWFRFEAEKLKEETIRFIESFDLEIVEVVDPRPKKQGDPVAIDPAEQVPLTNEEHEWILRGAWQVAASGGRTQLALLLKGSKNKALLKHNLQTSPAYGRLSFLTLEEIEQRVDRLIRQGELRLEHFGDLPLIVLTDETWERVRPWANQHMCTQAAEADDRKLEEMLMAWRNLRRDEQFHLIEATASLKPDAARRVLTAWSKVAGKEVRARIEEKLQESAAK